MHESTTQHKRPSSSETVSKADSGSGPASGSGSGSSSGGSGETARPAPAPPPETITFTFSSKSSPFAHLSPPGSFTFVSKKRAESDSSRDRSHRRQPPPAAPLPPGWISLSPLKPVTDISPPLFPADSKRTTAVFASSTSTKQSPRLSLVAQHHHATSPHPLFDAPPHLITPPPPDPFSELSSGGLDGYFPPMPRKEHSKSRPKPSTNIKHPQPRNIPSQPAPTTRSSSRALTIKPSKSQATPRALLPSASVPPQESSSSTPKRLQSRKSTPPQSRPSPLSQPSISVFRDCFGVLTHVENVFPARKQRSRSTSRSRSQSGSGAENVPGVGSGSGPSEFQKRWTRRWLRRTMRGVGSMGSGSTSSGGSGRMSGGQRLGSGGGSGGGMRDCSLGSGMGTPSSGAGSLVNAMVNLGMRALAATQADGSQDSLDRVRVSRSNAPSPTAATIASSEAEVDAGGNEAPAIAATA